MTGDASNENVVPAAGPTPSSDESAQTLRLRAGPPRITRLSRKVLAGGTAFAALLIAGAVLWALRSNHAHRPSPDELYSTDHHNIADGLATLPQDYAGIPSDVPRLGPPLPGEAGRAIAVTNDQSAASGLDAEQQRATRRPRRHGPANCLPQQRQASRRPMPNLLRRAPTPLHLPMNPSPRTDRIANSCSSMLPLIGGRHHLTGFHARRLLSSCRQARSFLRLC